MHANLVIATMLCPFHLMIFGIQCPSVFYQPEIHSQKGCPRQFMKIVQWRIVLSDSNGKLYRYGNHFCQWSTPHQWFYSGLEILKAFVKNNCIHETPDWLEFIIIILYIIQNILSHFRAFSIEGKTLETSNNTTLSVYLFCPCRAGLIKTNKFCYCDVGNLNL